MESFLRTRLRGYQHLSLFLRTRGKAGSMTTIQYLYTKSAKKLTLKVSVLTGNVNFNKKFYCLQNFFF